MLSTPISNGTPPPTERSPMTRTLSLNQDLKERQTLEKSNFDLKMTIFQLEDQLKMAKEQQTFVITDEEIISLKTELEQKNLLIMKAKAAIEALKAETIRVRNEEIENHKYQKDLEERIVLLTENEDTITAEFKRQFSKLETQFSVLKTKNHDFAELIAVYEARIEQLESSNIKLTETNKDLLESYSFLDFEKSTFGKLAPDEEKPKVDIVSQSELLMQVSLL